MLKDTWPAQEHVDSARAVILPQAEEGLWGATWGGSVSDALPRQGNMSGKCGQDPETKIRAAQVQGRRFTHTPHTWDKSRGSQCWARPPEAPLALPFLVSSPFFIP